MKSEKPTSKPGKPAVRGKLPLPVEQQIQLTESEQKALQAYQEFKLPTQSYTPPKPKHISELPEDEQAQVRAFLDRWQQPGKAAQAMQAAQATQAPRRLFDDDNTAAPPPIPGMSRLTQPDPDAPIFQNPAVGRAYQSLLDGSVEKLQEPAADAPVKEPVPAAETSDASGASDASGNSGASDAYRTPGGGAAPPSKCPHCEHDLNEEPLQVGEDDKIFFVAAVLSGERFIRTQSLLGGKLQVSWRSLSVSEATMIVHQVSLDAAAGKLGALAEAYDRLLLYRMTLSLESLVTADTSLPLGESIDDFLQKHPVRIGVSTPLPELVEKVKQLKPLNTENLWRILSDQFKQFGRLQEKLEAMASSESF